MQLYNKSKKPTPCILCILCFFSLLILFSPTIHLADVSGSCTSHQTGTTCPGHSHVWESPSTCKTCNGTTSATVTCSTCKGKGYTPNSLLGTFYSSKKTGIKACSCGWKGTTSETHYCLRLAGCSKCGGSGYIFYYGSSQFTTSNFTTAAKKGDSSLSGYTKGNGTTTQRCEDCYSSGTYKGKRTRCTRNNCSKHSYAPWSDFLNGTGTCYTDTCTPVYGNHDSNNIFQYNTMQHWTNCRYCNGSMGTISHTFGGEWTNNGYRYQSCNCGYSKNNGATTYYIAYHGNGATSGSTSTSTHSYHSNGFLNPNGFYRTGYTFLGWSTNAASSSPTYYDGQGISNLTQNHGETIQFYAIWKPNSYTLSFHSNGGTAPSVTSITTTYHSNSHASHTGIIPTRTGYTFLGWYTSIDGGNQVYDANGKCVNNTGYWTQNLWSYPNNLTLYAHWNRNVYTVTYLGNGGSVSADSQSNYYNEPVDLFSVNASKPGFIFTGWNTSPDAKVPLTSYTMPDGNLTLYAIYSIPVSDISGVYLLAWPSENPDTISTLTLSKTATQVLSYTYSISNVNLATLTGADSNSYGIVAYDNAGNQSILFQSSTMPPVDYYVQTVNHYFYHPSLQDWIWFDTSSTLKLIGETFTPTYLSSLPTGYIQDSIDSSYKVIGDQISKAYYKPATYVITFDATGGTVSLTQKNILYLDTYGDLPTPKRDGYTFIGWYTQKDGGHQITSNNKYETTCDTTLYAHWKINTHSVIYDYWTNGGDSVALYRSDKNYGDSIDLSVTATKQGWDFIGWNTDPDATTALDSLQLYDADLVLYGIYKKEITATFIDSNDKNTRTSTLTIYNRETSCNMSILELTEISGWTSLGWSLDPSPNSTIHATTGAEYPLTDNATFYGCYSKQVTITYDTNGSPEEISPETKIRFFNASGTYLNPTFTLACSPVLDQHSFIYWEALDVSNQHVGYFNEKEDIVFEKDIFLLAKWDQYPRIEAYNRYFTLEDAINGKITTDTLFEKVIVTDREDGSLAAGEQVFIKSFNKDDFINNTNLTITYQATDSFGNTTEKSITIHIINTSVKLSPIVYYPRFINHTFFSANNHMISKEHGGLEETSIWRYSETYKSLLENTLKTDAPIKTWIFTK